MASFCKYYLCLIATVLCFAAGNVMAGQCENPETLHVAINYQTETFASDERADLLIEYLEKALDKKINLLNSKSYAGSLKFLQTRQVDVARIGAKVYFHNQETHHDFEVFASVVNLVQETAGISGYRSQLVVLRDSPFGSVASLKNKRVALVDPGSTSGYLIPRLLFQDYISMSLGNYFSRTHISGSHMTSLKALNSGRIDGAFISSSVVDVLVNSETLSADQLKVLWSSRVIPSEPFVYRTTLCAELKRKISAAFLQMDQHRKMKTWLHSINALKISPATDENYTIIRQLIKRHFEQGKLKQ